MRHLPAFAAFAKPGLSAAVASCAASQLSEVQREALWALFEANMQAVYSADGQPWNPRAKRRELFHVRSGAPAAACMHVQSRVQLLLHVTLRPRACACVRRRRTRATCW